MSLCVCVAREGTMKHVIYIPSIVNERVWRLDLKSTITLLLISSYGLIKNFP
jgi:hypothetical protein